MRLILIALLLTGALVARAQHNPPKNSIQLGLGLDNTFFRDLNYSPLNHKSKGTVVDLAYSHGWRNSDLSYFNIDLAGKTLSTSRNNEFKATHLLLNWEIGHLKKIKGVESFDFSLGIQAHSYNDLVIYDGDESVNFFALHGFDITGQVEKKFSNRHQLSSRLAITAYGKLVRPPHTGWDKYIGENSDKIGKILTRGHWTSMHEFTAVNWRIQYSYKVSKRITLYGKYQLRYYHTDLLDKSTIVTNQFIIGTQFNF